MLVECGFTKAQAPDGSEWTFTPALGRIATLGDPREIVQLFADLHGPRATEAARYVLACLCDQDDVTPLIGWRDESGRHPGAMPEAEQVLIARHLMQHGIIGKAKPGNGGGKYAETFNAAEFVAAAVAHLGMQPSAAEALSMSELQLALEAKFPEMRKAERPSRDEYRDFMARVNKKGASGG